MTLCVTESARCDQNEVEIPLPIIKSSIWYINTQKDGIILLMERSASLLVYMYLV